MDSEESPSGKFVTSKTGVTVYTDLYVYVIRIVSENCLINLVIVSDAIILGIRAKTYIH